MKTEVWQGKGNVIVGLSLIQVAWTFRNIHSLNYSTEAVGRLTIIPLSGMDKLWHDFFVAGLRRPLTGTWWWSRAWRGFCLEKRLKRRARNLSSRRIWQDFTRRSSRREKIFIISMILLRLKSSETGSAQPSNNFVIMPCMCCIFFF